MDYDLPELPTKAAWETWTAREARRKRALVESALQTVVKRFKATYVLVSELPIGMDFEESELPAGVDEVMEEIAQQLRNLGHTSGWEVTIERKIDDEADDGSHYWEISFA